MCETERIWFTRIRVAAGPFIGSDVCIINFDGGTLWCACIIGSDTIDGLGNDPNTVRVAPTSKLVLVCRSKQIFYASVYMNFGIDKIILWIHTKITWILLGGLPSVVVYKLIYKRTAIFDWGIFEIIDWPVVGSIDE